MTWARFKFGFWIQVETELYQYMLFRTMDTDRPSKDKSPKDRSRQGSEHEDDRSDISFRHNEDTKGNLLEERNSNTSIPHEEDKYRKYFTISLFLNDQLCQRSS